MKKMISKTFILDLLSKTFKFRVHIEIGPNWKVNIGILTWLGLAIILQIVIMDLYKLISY